MATRSSHLRQAVSIGASLSFALAIGLGWYANRLRRSRWLETDKEQNQETTHSVINHFSSLILDPETTVEEANKRRTTSYYLKMREAHHKSLVLGVYPSRLKKLRKKEIDRTLSYGTRAIRATELYAIQCKAIGVGPSSVLQRYDSLSAWIPDLNIIPKEDMHVTIALPWWWHTIRPGNNELTKKMANNRFKQTLLVEFHYGFQIELERIVLLGGKVLVALWRCVGERETDDGRVIVDRHGTNIDPMVWLREEIVRCFITESPDQRRQPLTYQHNKSEGDKAEENAWQNTIMQRTPGMGKPGSADGFIHTTLCRLPLDCLSSKDIELDELHRLCREVSATLNGHRMVVDKYRFIETMGEGGESNPCYKPIYDEIIEAPARHEVHIDGTVESRNAQVSDVLERHNTIGPSGNFWNEEVVAPAPSTDTQSSGTTLSALFEPPKK
ncbi:hypothetical protein QTG54_017040 [Skeletonema marinoi]|uniref:Uncharacterized protein n=1 Tax=Skeletonema marinoi TaxID=267567 RepID=A0AAD8XRV6_9STRA|nr:hypothetical protein QTG54_017040 [Skeletonema marinoi]